MTVTDPTAIASSGALWLAKAVNAKGRFRYRITEQGAVDHSAYNVLRHSGTIWAMAATRAVLGSSVAATDAPLRRAIKYLIEEFVRSAGKGAGSYVVEDDNYKLGGNALAIVALTEMAGLTGLPMFMRVAEQLGAGILERRMPDGEFIHKQRFSSGEITPWRSDYYDGQAVFALLRLNQLKSNVGWLDAGTAALTRLRARGHGISTQDHWTLYALEQYAACADPAEFRPYADAVADAVIADDGYREDRRGTPVACRSEGLLAYLRMVGERIDPSRRAAIVAAIRDNLALQLLSRRSDGRFVESADGGDTRIDYVQHNVAAFLGYARLPGAMPLPVAA